MLTADHGSARLTAIARRIALPRAAFVRACRIGGVRWASPIADRRTSQKLCRGLAALALAAAACSSDHADDLPLVTSNSRPLNATVSTLGTPASRSHGYCTLVARRTDGAWCVFNQEEDIYEYRYVSSGWSKTRVGGGDGSPANRLGPPSFLAAATRDDGRSRLYTTQTSSAGLTFLELEYADGRWSSRAIMTLPGIYSTPWMVPGDPRREGRSSLYCTYSATGQEALTIGELRYADDRWRWSLLDESPLPNGSNSGTLIVDLRGDGVPLIYLVTTRFLGSPAVFEYTFAPGRGFAREYLLDLPVARHVLTYFVRLAGDRRALHAFSSQGYHEGGELTFGPSGWSSRNVAGDWKLGGPELCLAWEQTAGGGERLYCAGTGGVLEQYSFGDALWTITGEHVVSLNAALASIALGPGRGDGTRRLYIQIFDNFSSQPLVEVSVPDP